MKYEVWSMNQINIKNYRKIEKEIVRKVDRGDKPYLRKSSYCKAPISPLSWINNVFLICGLRCQIFSGKMYHPSHLTHMLFFYSQ